MIANNNGPGNVLGLFLGQIRARLPIPRRSRTLVLIGYPLMHHASIQSMAAELEAGRQKDGQNGHWLASRLFSFLRMRNYAQFEDLVGAAAEICTRKGIGSDRHIRPTRPIEHFGEHGPAILDEYQLSAYGAFLLAKHLDDNVPGVRFLLNYFPAADRDWLPLALRIDAWERLHARAHLRQLEKEFAHALRNFHLDDDGYGLLKSAGDKVLFGGQGTRAIKARLGIDPDHTLSDYLPAVTLRARIQADAHTIHALEENPRRSEDELAELHRQSAMLARQALLEIWVRPEWLPAEEAIHHVETRFRHDLERIMEEHLPNP